jgi:hypothetical protein
MPSKVTKYKQRVALAETINSYGSPAMACSNCGRYHRNCVVLNEKSQRCGECVRRGVRCDVLQTSVDDLQNLRLEEERLKFERDMAFEAAMAGLARVRELEARQQELRERGREMLRRGLRTLDELDAAEAEERRAAEEARKQAEADGPGQAATGPPPDPLGALALDPSDPFWADLGFHGGSWQAAPDTGGLT